MATGTGWRQRRATWPSQQPRDWMWWALYACLAPREFPIVAAGRIACRTFGFHNTTCRGKRDHGPRGRYWSFSEWHSRWTYPPRARLGVAFKRLGCRLIHGHHLWRAIAVPDGYEPREQCWSCGELRISQA
ncbi:hypothetical protein [Actinokineospora sp. UTMC 2448]|uniref:hypothetical protein n=1 Tax=Actinokineospora sp. UTMC 2448 TaxID=2268449 RepID=UPI0021648C68|nr:hypothetical protein [Actinokineospora sp. UTMC 2448]UVS81830.1 hypothetical protein Actkin_05594 [Actinokineospora sp. UTMC 2448]